MKKLLIIGASGHGMVIADIAKLNGYDSILFFDDSPSAEYCGKYKVIGSTDNICKFDGDIFIAVGNSVTREKIYNRFSDRSFPVLIHPNAVISDTAVIAKGTAVMAGAVVNPYAQIGKFCIINTCSSIDHECKIGDFVHAAVGSHIAGAVNIGCKTWIGAGATVSNNINICENCMIGAGAVVVKDITESGTYVGVPAKKIKDGN